MEDSITGTSPSNVLKSSRVLGDVSTPDVDNDLSGLHHDEHPDHSASIPADDVPMASVTGELDMGSSTLLGKRWTEEEDRRMAELVFEQRKNGVMSWAVIAAAMGNNRTQNSCQLHWSSMKKARHPLTQFLAVATPLRREAGTPRTEVADPDSLNALRPSNIALPPGASSSHSPADNRKWTAEDDEMLIDFVKQFGGSPELRQQNVFATPVMNWSNIAMLMPGNRTANACQLHWASMKKRFYKKRQLDDSDGVDESGRRMSVPMSAGGPGGVLGHDHVGGVHVHGRGEELHAGAAAVPDTKGNGNHYVDDYVCE